MTIMDLKDHGGCAYNVMKCFTQPRFAPATNATHSLVIAGGVTPNDCFRFVPGLARVVVHRGDVGMNEKQLALIETLQDMINGTLDTYEKDPHHAPAKWLLENWWCTLEAIKRA